MAAPSEPQTSSLWRVSSLANPTNFMRLSGKLLPWLIALTLILFAIGLSLATAFRVPPNGEYGENVQAMGETVRIMFVHVPAAWLSMACYTLIALSSAGYLIWRHPLADVSAKAAAPIGAAFTLLALVTGSLWGRPSWGTYWEWDLRLTSELILFFLYLGLIALRQAIDEPGRAGRATAILSIIGFVFIPIIKLSVEPELMKKWLGIDVVTLHQPASVITPDGPRMVTALLAPLLIVAIAFTSLFAVLHLKAMRAEILRRRCEALIAVHVRRDAVQERPEGPASSHV
jgi:heme exporter protein C